MAVREIAAYAYSALGRYADAEREYAAAARVGRPNPRLLASRSWALRKLGRYDEARGVVDRGLALFPGRPELEAERRHLKE